MIGQLRSRVKFEQNAPTTLGAGKKDAYTELLTTWGELKKNSGQRVADALSEKLISSYTLHVRKQEALANGLDKKTRVVINNRFFTIVSYELVQQKQFFYKFELKEDE